MPFFLKHFFFILTLAYFTCTTCCFVPDAASSLSRVLRTGPDFPAPLEIREVLHPRFIQIQTRGASPQFDLLYSESHSAAGRTRKREFRDVIPKEQTIVTYGARLPELTSKDAQHKPCIYGRACKVRAAASKHAWKNKRSNCKHSSSVRAFC